MLVKSNVNGTIFDQVVVKIGQLRIEDGVMTVHRIEIRSSGAKRIFQVLSVLSLTAAA